DDIVDDYALTATRLDAIHARLRMHPLFQLEGYDLSAPMFDAEAETMARFLAGIDERYGGAHAWAEAAGISPDTIDRLRLTLVTWAERPRAGYPGEQGGVARAARPVGPRAGEWSRTSASRVSRRAGRRGPSGPARRAESG